MPHKYYHGKTGIVYNITRRAIGVVVNKKVGGKIMAKKVRVQEQSMYLILINMYVLLYYSQFKALFFFLAFVD